MSRFSISSRQADAASAVALTALREKTTAQQVETQMRLAMLAGMLQCHETGSDAWQQIPARGECPAPEELIVWAAGEALRRLAVISFE